MNLGRWKLSPSRQGEQPNIRSYVQDRQNWPFDRRNSIAIVKKNAAKYGQKRDKYGQMRHRYGHMRLEYGQMRTVFSGAGSFYTEAVSFAGAPALFGSRNT